MKTPNNHTLTITRRALFRMMEFAYRRGMSRGLAEKQPGTQRHQSRLSEMMTSRLHHDTIDTAIDTLEILSLDNYKA